MSLQSLFMYLVNINFELILAGKSFEAQSFQKILNRFQNFNSFLNHILNDHLLKIMNVCIQDLLN